MKKHIIIILNCIICILFIIKLNKKESPVGDSFIALPQVEAPKESYPKISVVTPNYLDYDYTVNQLKTWENEASDFVEVGTYGKSTKGKDLYFIRLTNESTNNKPKVLITACIHGNEPHSASVIMAYIGNMLNDYRKDKNLLDKQEIYFIPIVSPDSYPFSRHVDNVDPNRNFNDNSVLPIKNLKEFFLKHKFKSVISGHTWGRMYLTPYGDKKENCPNVDDYNNIIGQMCKLSGYKMMRAYDLYGNNKLNINPIERVLLPIYGTEVDWYYRNGSFSIVCEFGTHQRIPSKQEIDNEFNRTYNAFLYFCKESVNVTVN